MPVREDGRCATCEGFIQQAGCSACGSKRMREMAVQTEQGETQGSWPLVDRYLSTLEEEGNTVFVNVIRQYISGREKDLDWVRQCHKSEEDLNKLNAAKLKEAVAEKVRVQNAFLEIKQAVEDAEL